VTFNTAWKGGNFKNLICLFNIKLYFEKGGETMAVGRNTLGITPPTIDELYENCLAVSSKLSEEDLKVYQGVCEGAIVHT